MIPYGRQIIDSDDKAAVAAVLGSDWLTTGPQVEAFEQQMADFCGARHAVAASNGTAALHLAFAALGVGPGDEVIVPALTFVATANAVRYCGGTVVFADVNPQTLLIDVQDVARKITGKTKAVAGVDYAGQTCHWQALQELAQKHGLKLVADAAHAIGAQDELGRKVGTLAHITCLSFHPVKQMTTGEGGMALSNDEALATRMRLLRGHGIVGTAREREAKGAWHYEMRELGFNYRITDMQCALGRSQLKKLPTWLEKRNELAQRYSEAFAATAVQPLALKKGVRHAWHLYVVQVPQRDKVFLRMRQAGVGVNVHYMPVHLHPYYQQSQGTGPGLCPAAESAFERILTLPLWPGLKAEEQAHIIKELLQCVG